MTIARVEEIKFLGIILDEGLKFRGHVLQIAGKISKYAHIFYKIKRFFRICDLIKIYNSLVYPNLNYGVSVWGGAYSNAIVPLQTAQNRVLRAMCGVGRLETVEPLYSSLKIFKVSEVHRYVTSCYVYRTLQAGSRNLFVYRTFNRTTRQAESAELFVPLTLSQACRQGISYRGPVIFNGIPQNIREIQRYSVFKRYLRSFLLNSHTFVV